MSRTPESVLRRAQCRQGSTDFPQLVDPASGARLHHDGDALVVAGDAAAAGDAVPAAGVRYPVVHGIPRVLPSGDNYAAAFGAQWNSWRRTQLDSHTGLPISRVSPLLTYCHVYPDLSHALQREWALLDTHDSLTDWFKHLRTPEQIRATLESLGGIDTVSVPGGIGVEARCRRG